MNAPRTHEPISLPLDGLKLAPPQVYGGVRLVPLIREDIREDLRLSRRTYAEDVAVVDVDSKTSYTSYIPHGLVANWSIDGSAAFGTQFDRSVRKKDADGRVYHGIVTARGLRKMVRREGKQQLRFLPLHVAMEGFLALHFGGPTVAWSEYSRAALRDGLSPRSESVVPGREITALEDALRIFEIHRDQVGVLVFVADALASAFVVPHPDDYLRLHRTLVTDFYGDLIWRYGLYASENVLLPDEIDAGRVDSIDDLRRELKWLRSRWATLHRSMAAGLIDRDIDSKRVYRFKPFSLARFMTDLDPKAENHIGETIHADDGTLQYLKTYRLSAAQCRRAFLLKQLAEADWELDRLAEELSCRRSQLILRLENAGFGYLLHQHVLDAARRAERF